MKAPLKQSDAVLEPELRELCGELDAIQRAKTAEKFMRWADQLTESAMRMDPKLIPLVPPPKVPRGFILVNLAKWREEKIRALAKEFGCDLRSVLGWAITTTWMDLEEKLKIARMVGISPRACWRFVEGNEKN